MIKISDIRIGQTVWYIKDNVPYEAKIEVIYTGAVETCRPCCNLTHKSIDGKVDLYATEREVLEASINNDLDRVETIMRSISILRERLRKLDG